MAASLRHEPEIGPGTINRVIRELLATKQYRRTDSLAVGGQAGPRHQATRRRAGSGA
jgi:hypothetical protein